MIHKSNLIFLNYLFLSKNKNLDYESQLLLYLERSLCFMELLLTDFPNDANL